MSSPTSPTPDFPPSNIAQEARREALKAYATARLFENQRAIAQILSLTNSYAYADAARDLSKLAAHMTDTALRLETGP